MNKDKICLFIPSMEGGGAEKVFVNLANYLERNKYEYDLLLGKKIGPNLSKILNLNKIFSLNKRGRSYFFHFIKYLNKNRPQVVISTLISANFTNCISKLIYLKKIKRIVREANIIILPRNILQKIILIMIYQSYYLADKIIVNSKDTKLSLLKIVPFLKNIEIIHNPVFDLKYFDSNFIKNKKKLNNITFVSIGRLVDQKNFKLLIDAFEIVDKNYDVNLNIYGEGNLELELKKIVKSKNLDKKINFVKYTDNIKNIFAFSSIFVLSSKFEGFGNVIVESLLYATPVVSTNCKGGPLEILCNGKYGTISEQNKYDLSDKMILTINKIKKNKINYQDLQKRALDFSTENIAEKFFNI